MDEYEKQMRAALEFYEDKGYASCIDEVKKAGDWCVQLLTFIEKNNAVHQLLICLNLQTDDLFINCCPVELNKDAIIVAIEPHLL